ncbi:MAG: penicillin-binding protein 2 [Anaerolineales bacterium]|jgi:cell division protein FtsI/penicillin-binding protein 2|nr:penicillin-binding protein 2 [Anaerolineales bacterium]
MKIEYSWRYMLVGAILLALPVLILFQLLRIQTNPDQREEFKTQLENMLGETATLTPPRGLIYDRWGNLLAGNQTVYEVGVELNQVENARAIALATSLVLGMDYNEIYNLITNPAGSDLIHVTIAKGATQDQYEKLVGMRDDFEKANLGLSGKETPSLAGLSFRAYLQRTYPEKSLASNLLGFVNSEGNAFYGVEQWYDDWLSGKTQQYYWAYNPVEASLVPDVPDGSSLILTIDREIQASMEDLVDEVIDQTGSDSASIVVLDPRTNDILAMATTPRVDLNRFWDVPEIFQGETPFNRAVSSMYEPGSVYKVLTMAAGLDSGAVNVDTEYLDQGVITIGGNPITNWNQGAWGPQSMQGCMQHSLNVCLAWIAKQMGVTTFYGYMERFGIGHLTGVDLAGEIPGRLKVPGDSDWYEADLGTNSFGQGVSVTPLQMAVSASAIANDGKVMAPHIVRARVAQGYQIEVKPEVLSAPISEETADALTEMLARSLETESSDALVEGYRLAGKTGTAQIPTPFGYTSDLTNASFIGWGPVDDPRFLVYVWLEKPKTSVWASEVAAPVFSEAVKRLVVLMNLPPDDVRQELLGQ